MPTITFFDDVFAKRARPVEINDTDLAELIANPDAAPSKDRCPLLKLGRFGDKRTPKDSLRSDENLVAVWGAEGDYDGERVPMTNAAALCEQAGIRALFYTSPSHKPDAPRWRVLVPFSKEYAPEQRNRFLARLNGVLGGVLTGESFTLSQTFYIGHVNGAVYDHADIDGDCIDLRGDLDARAVWPDTATKDRPNDHPEFDGDKLTALIHQVMSGENYHEALNRIAASYIKRGMQRDDVIAVLQAMMLSHRTDNVDRWQTRYDDIPRSVDSAVAKYAQPPVTPELKQAIERMQNSGDPFEWTGGFTMTDAEIEDLADPEWIYENLIIAGHLIVIPAEPNAGKTTIMEWVCGQISDAYRVIYVNADISGGDAKTAYRKAKEGGYTLLLPDMKAGRSMDDVVAYLIAMNELDTDLSDVVMVFDTLKKMVDVISKQKSRELYKALRSLTAKGITIVLLAHTNKHKGDDGKPVFEGTGDLRADVDEMIYLIPLKNDDGSMLVSTEPDKVRGQFERITFEIGAPPGREVQQIDFFDVAKERRDAARREADAEDIEIIHAFLRTGSKKQSEIVAHCKDENLGRRRVLTLLKRYTRGDGAIWVRRDGNEKNAAIYSHRTEPGYLRK